METTPGMRALLLEALQLKSLPRTGWVRAGVRNPESVAAHSWGVAWLVAALCPAHLDQGRALLMAVLHDLAEVHVGDLTPHDPVSSTEKHAREERAMSELLGRLPAGEVLLAAWREFEAGRTPEARLVRACDRLDMGLQARIYSTSQGLDLAEFLQSASRALEGSDLQGLLDPGGD